MPNQPIIASCTCGRRFQARPELAGRRVKCPACGQPLQVPALGASPAAPSGLDWGDEFAANPPRPGPNVLRPRAPAAATPGRRPKQASVASGASGKVVLWIAIGAAAFCALPLVGFVGINVLGRVGAARQQAVRESQEAGPVVYEGGGYRVEMPGRPRPKMENVGTGVRTKTVFQATYDRGNVDRGNGQRFSVAYSTMPLRPEPHEVDAALEAAVRGAGFKGHMTSKRDVMVGQHQGKEFTFEGNEAGRTFAGKIRFVVGDTSLYQIVWLTAPAQPETAEVRRFFDSFEFTASANPPTP